MIKIFHLTRHDLTYYFQEFIQMYHGGKEGTFEKERVETDLEYQIKRDREMDKIWECVLNHLTDNEVQCFYLYYLERVPQERIAELMEISQEAVYKFLKKAIKKIKRNIDGNLCQGTIIP